MLYQISILNCCLIKCLYVKRTWCRDQRSWARPAAAAVWAQVPRFPPDPPADAVPAPPPVLSLVPLPTCNDYRVNTPLICIYEYKKVRHYPSIQLALNLHLDC